MLRRKVYNQSNVRKQTHQKLPLWVKVHKQYWCFMILQRDHLRWVPQVHYLDGELTGRSCQ